MGGTSAAFGPALTGITASAGSGSAANGAQAAAQPGQTITLAGRGLGLATEVVFYTTDSNGTRDDVIVRPSAVNGDGTEAQVVVPVNATSGEVRVLGSAAAIMLQIVPLIVDVQIEWVASDGSTAQVLVAGLGFVEGGNSEYRFGDTVILDAGPNTGTDVFGRSDPVLGFIANGYARMTVPLSDGAFGAITAKTAGGTSAAFTVNLASITSAAFSGTPADATKAAANAGQAVTLVGSGLNTSTDVLLRWSDINGTAQMTRLSPDAAAGDGTSATLTIPQYANGAYTLQVLGSASQPLLQIVPTLTRYDQQDRIVLFGSGYVEGASTYSFAGATVVDTPALGNNVDVYYDGDQNGSAYINRSALASHGLGGVTVTTAGGSSAALALNLVQVAPAEQGPYLGDVAIDPVSGAMWVSDYNNPGHLKRIDPASGAVLQTLEMTAGYGTPYTYNHAGLQILGVDMTLGGTNVPAGSLLVFSGYANPDRVLAVNPADGTIVATRILAGNYDLTAGVYDATTGSLFILDNAGSQMREINPATGAQIGAAIALPINVQSWAGLAIDPVSGNFWIGSSSGGGQVVEIRRNGTEVRRIALTTQGINEGEISGLAFGTDGKLWVASTQGVVYKVDLG